MSTVRPGMVKSAESARVGSACQCDAFEYSSALMGQSELTSNVIPMCLSPSRLGEAHGIVSMHASALAVVSNIKTNTARKSPHSMLGNSSTVYPLRVSHPKLTEKSVDVRTIQDGSDAVGCLVTQKSKGFVPSWPTMTFPSML